MFDLAIENSCQSLYVNPQLTEICLIEKRSTYAIQIQIKTFFPAEGFSIFSLILRVQL
jgi:hypothetical protein